MCCALPLYLGGGWVKCWMASGSWTSDTPSSASNRANISGSFLPLFICCSSSSCIVHTIRLRRSNVRTSWPRSTLNEILPGPIHRRKLLGSQERLLLSMMLEDEESPLHHSPAPCTITKHTLYSGHGGPLTFNFFSIPDRWQHRSFATPLPVAR